MLKRRVITALVLAPPVIAGFFFLSGLYFALFIGAIILVAAWEFAGMAGFEGGSRYLYGIAVALAMLGAYFVEAEWVLSAGVLWWCVALLLVISYPDAVRYWRGRWQRSLMGVVVLVPAWVSLIQLRAFEDSTFLLFVLLFLIWGADIGAYFAGRAFGSVKLAPAVSPGKSWEGVAGGAAAAMAVVAAALAIRTSESAAGPVGLFLAICLLVVFVSVLGDLTESMLKRHVGIKDSSALLPGHGGVLDRIDSILAAGPVFAFSLSAAGWR